MFVTGATVGSSGCVAAGMCLMFCGATWIGGASISSLVSMILICPTCVAALQLPIVSLLCECAQCLLIAAWLLNVAPQSQVIHARSARISFHLTNGLCLR